tara:strand:+ start:289 stop:528 length:240 start_codon:yes stop_codon:yes gene_type:complete
MSIYYSILFSIFGVVMIMIVIDPNIGMWIDLQLQNLVVQLKRRYYIITLGTVLKYQNWKLMRELETIRKERNLPDETDK